MFLNLQARGFLFLMLSGVFLVSLGMTGCAAPPTPAPDPQPVATGPTPEELAKREAEAAKQAELQKQKDTAEQAVKAGRLDEALGIFLKLLEEAGTYDSDLGGSAMAVVQKMETPPPIPEQARKHFIYANTALKNAQKLEDVAVALGEYYKALKLAPWVSEYFWNLSLAYKQHEDYLEARDALKIYFSAERKNLNPQQIKAIQENIYQLEYRAQEKVRKMKELGMAQERKRQARQRILQQRERCLKKVQDAAGARAWNIFESYQSYDRWHESELARCKTTYSVD